jgi:hypothetical protein
MIGAPAENAPIEVEDGLTVDPHPKLPSRRGGWHAAGRSVRPCEQQVVLDGDHLGDLGGDDCHRILGSVQPVSGAEQGTDGPKFVIGRLVHDGDQQVASQECRKLLVRDPAPRASATPG